MRLRLYLGSRSVTLPCAGPVDGMDWPDVWVTGVDGAAQGTARAFHRPGEGRVPVLADRSHAPGYSHDY